MTLEFLLCLSAAWHVGGGAITQREELMRILEAHRNIQWPVPHH